MEVPMVVVMAMEALVLQWVGTADCISNNSE